MLILHHPHFKYNKYFAWYKNIIVNFISNPPLVDYEIHHILPKSMGGSNDPSNLVRLPIRYHYVAHLLLWKSTQSISHQKMAYAVVSMRAGRELVTNSRLFEAAKKTAIEYKRVKTAGMFSAVDSQGNTYYIHQTDLRYVSGELVAKSKGRLKGYTQSDEHRQKLAATKLAQSNPNHKWIITTPLGVFNSLGEAASAHNTSRTTVLNRCDNHKFPDWIKSLYTSTKTHDESLS